MTEQSQLGLLAVEVGTSRVKLGWFPSDVVCTSDRPFGVLPIAAPRLPEPADTLAIQHRGVPESDFVEQLTNALKPYDELSTSVAVAFVDANAFGHVFEVLKKCERLALPRILDVPGLPIQLAVREPHRVGIDRALAAMAVNRVRAADAPAIIVSLGTACTVNLISADGAFEGGAILPGLAMAAKALHTGTASLPLVAAHNLEAPPIAAVGKDTIEAITVGIYWGLVGALEKLVQHGRHSLGADPQLFFTGGDAPLIVEAFKADGFEARLMPHLVLSGIAIACEAQP